MKLATTSSFLISFPSSSSLPLAPPSFRFLLASHTPSSAPSQSFNTRFSASVLTAFINVAPHLAHPSNLPVLQFVVDILHSIATKKEVALWGAQESRLSRLVKWVSEAYYFVEKEDDLEEEEEEEDFLGKLAARMPEIIKKRKKKEIEATGGGKRKEQEKSR